MNAHLIAWIALAGPQGLDATVDPVELVAAPWTTAELRQQCTDVVSRSRDPEQFSAERDVPVLLATRAIILSSDALSRTEQVRSRRKIDFCLEKARLRLDRRRAHLAKLAQRPSTPKMPSQSSDLSGGAAEAQRVRQLIDLIEMTIQPETWANNGGRGTIGYWAPGYALVIRNNQAVHEEIGGALGVLHAQAR